MPIICTKCNYNMTRAEAAGYLTADLYEFLKKDIISLYTQPIKKNHSNIFLDTIDQYIVGILNKTETKCHTCKEYINWILVSEIKKKESDAKKNPLSHTCNHANPLTKSNAS